MFLFRIQICGGFDKYTLSCGLRRSTHSWGLRRFAYLVGYVDLHILGGYPMGEVRISLFLHLWCIIKEVVLVNQHISAQWGQSASLACDCGCCCWLKLGMWLWLWLVAAAVAVETYAVERANWRNQDFLCCGSEILIQCFSLSFSRVASMKRHRRFSFLTVLFVFAIHAHTLLPKHSL